MTVLGRIIWSVVALIGTLVFEVVLAMVIFTFLAINQQDLFNSFVNVSDQMLVWVKDLLRSMFPTIQDEIFGGAVGDLSARAFLLLILGLLASGIIRLVVWSVRSMLRRDY